MRFLNYLLHLLASTQISLVLVRRTMAGATTTAWILKTGQDAGVNLVMLFTKTRNPAKMWMSVSIRECAVRYAATLRAPTSAPVCPGIS